MSIKHRSLLHLAVKVPGDACEVGVAEGRYSEEILAWPCNFPRVYLVDRWAQETGVRGDSSLSTTWHEENFRRVRGIADRFSERVVLLRGHSFKMAELVPDASLAFLYIDADHSYEGALQDLLCYAPKVKKGGVIGLHDYLNADYGVQKAVEDFLQLNPRPIEVVEENHPNDASALLYW